MTWRWPNKFLDTITEQGITFPVPKVLVEIIPLHSSTQERRILVKVMLSFKNRNFVRFEQKNINENLSKRISMKCNVTLVRSC